MSENVKNELDAMLRSYILEVSGTDKNVATKCVRNEFVARKFPIIFGLEYFTLLSTVLI